MKVEELMRSLYTYELNLIQKKKVKLISLKAKNKSMDSAIERNNDGQLALLINNFKNS